MATDRYFSEMREALLEDCQLTISKFWKMKQAIRLKDEIIEENRIL